MTEAATLITVKSATAIAGQPQTLKQTSVFVGGDTGGGITQLQADARYVRLAQINAANGVAGLDASEFVGEDNLPLPPVTLTVLLANKLA